MVAIAVKAPLTVPLYLYFASAKYRYTGNGTVRGALTITYEYVYVVNTWQRAALFIAQVQLQLSSGIVRCTCSIYQSSYSGEHAT